jgi:hypothetical protein
VKKTRLFIILLISFIGLSGFSQVGINSRGAPPDSSAMLDVQAADKGVLIPRLTIQQRDSIQNAAEGLMVFCLDCGSEGALTVFSNGSWKSFAFCSCPAPASDGNHSQVPGQITWRWNAIPDAKGFKWNTSDDYFTATDIGVNYSKVETGIQCGSVYTRYIWAYNSCAVSGFTVLHDTVSQTAPTQCTAGNHISFPDQITWEWNAVPGASSYKWGRTNNYQNAYNVGEYTSFTETGLNNNTTYNRYVWAQNGCGHSSSRQLTETTLYMWTCGDSLVINHVAGDVAPVSKTTIYNTVNNVPGEPTKCWITSNLGAAHQASAKDDACEASAGWYWQFNRARGFMHDGVTRTPNITWISDINEYSTWISYNDPCNLELGTGWRVPSISEWNNVDSTGNWGNWNGPWNSVLKIHAAGRLDYYYGTLSDRGLKGLYWSNSQTALLTMSQSLYFFSGNSCDNNFQKSYAFTIRCIKD